jgi:tRNA(Ile)-lysidine synthase
VREDASGLRLSLAMLDVLPPALRPHLLVRAYRALGTGGEVGSRHVHALERLLGPGRPERAAHLPGRVVALRDASWLTLRRDPRFEPGPAQAFEAMLPVPGAALLPGGRSCRIRVGRPPRVFVEEQDGAWLAQDLIGEPLRIRSPRPSDRFHPLGAPGSKRLKELFIDHKIPRAERGGTVVLDAGGRIAWVQGLPPAEFARVPAGAKRALRIEIAPSPTESTAPEEDADGRQS